MAEAKQHLRSNVPRRPTRGLHQVGLLVEKLAQPKVGDLADCVRALGSHQHVLGLQVAVGDALVVHELQRLEQLVSGALRVGLREVANVDDAVEQLRASAPVADGLIR